MPVRLVITTYAKPGQGAALAQAMADRCRAVQQEPGCQQFEVFQSALDPDKLVVLELWDDQAALDVHAQVNVARPPNPALAALRAGGGREVGEVEGNDHVGVALDAAARTWRSSGSGRVRVSMSAS